MAARENLPPPSIMVRRFLGAEPICKAGVNYSFPAFRKELYFFYGTLMDPRMLAKVLNLRDRPVLLSAKIVGYRLMLWGPYPALLNNPLGPAVYGMAYEVQSSKEVERLEAYETNHYRRTACMIELEDGRRVKGRTFKWDADEGDLKEGVFDLKDWQMDNVKAV